MAKPFVFTKRIKGNDYYYLGLNKRIDGQSRRIWELYLGPVDKITEVSRISEFHIGEPTVRAFGDVAAVLSIAEEIDLVEIFNSNIEKRNQPPSVGEYALIAIINRCADPCSKNGIEEWYEKTALPYLLNIEQSKLTSQNYWHQMEYMSEAVIRSIEYDISKQCVEAFDLDLHQLIFDPTNFHTYISEFNGKGNVLPKYGKSKSKRYDLLQINVGLLVTTDFNVPLFHKTYEGNTHDTQIFPKIIDELTERLSRFSKQCDDITIVCDKGVNSKKNINKVDKSPYHFVGSLKPSDFKDLMAIDLAKFEYIYDSSKGHPVWAYRLKREVFGIERTVVVTFYWPTYNASVRSLFTNIEKLKEKIEEFKAEKLNTGKWKNKKAVKDKLEGMMNAKKSTKNILEIKTRIRNGKVIVEYGINWDEFVRREKNFGKTILFTDRDYWPTERIIRVFRGRNEIEKVIKELKDPDIVRITPMYHWTDQKIRVHVFICVLGYLVLSLMRRKLHYGGVDLTIKKMMKQLSAIMLVELETKRLRPGRPKLVLKLTKRTKEQRRLYEILGLEEMWQRTIGT